MPVIDLIVLAVLLLYLAKGLWRGVLPELCSVCGLLVGLFLASRFAPGLGAELARIGHLGGGGARSFLFVVLFFIGTFSFALLGFIVGRLPPASRPGGASRVSGGLLGLVQGVTMLALLLQALVAHGWLTPPLARATLAPPFVQLGTAVYRGGAVLAALAR